MTNLAEFELSSDPISVEPMSLEEVDSGTDNKNQPSLLNNLLVLGSLGLLLGGFYFAYTDYLIFPVTRPKANVFKPFQPQGALALALNTLPSNRSDALNRLSAADTNSSPIAEARRLYALAILKQNSGEYEEALSIFQKINLRNLPYLADRVLIHQAEIGAEIGNEKLVIDSCRKILVAFSDSLSVPAAHYEMGRSYLRQGQKEKAANEFQSLRASHPRSQHGLGALYYLGELNENIGQRNALWNEYLRSSPKGRFSANIVTVWQMPLNFESLSNDQKASLGMVYFLSDRPELAFPLLDQYRQPGDFLALASLQLKHNQKDQAIQTVLAGLKLKLEENQFNEGVSFLIRNSKKESSLLYLEELIGSVPSQGAYLIWRKANLTTGAQRRRILQELLAAYPSNLWSSEASQELFWEAFKSQNWAQAKSLGQAHIALYPRHYTTTRVRFWLGKLAELEGDNSLAGGYYQDLVRQGPITYYYFRAQQRQKYLQNGLDEGWSVDLGFSPPELGRTLKSQKTFPMPEIEVSKLHPTIRELFALNLWQEAHSLFPDDYEKSFPLLQAWYIARVQESPVDGIKVAARELSKGKPNLQEQPESWLLAYPFIYGEYVLDSCDAQGFDPLLLLGLIRQESRFDHKAISKSKATGLCQLLPSTAREVARQINLAEPNNSLLTTPAYNIQLGSKYLGDMIRRFEGKPYLAIAAYNAGPGNASKWDQNQSYGYLIDHYDPDYFIEQIPFSETQKYVTNVYENYWVYKVLARRIKPKSEEELTLVE